MRPLVSDNLNIQEKQVGARVWELKRSVFISDAVKRECVKETEICYSEVQK